VNVLGMRACKRVHDKLSCTRLQNYTIGASLLGIRIQIPKSNIPIICSVSTGSIIITADRHRVEAMESALCALCRSRGRASCSGRWSSGGHFSAACFTLLPSIE